MKIIVTGSAGQLGAELCRLLGPRAVPIDIDVLDLTDREAVLDKIVPLAPAAILHCAAYTQVDKAETEPDRCRAVNVGAVEHLAEACRRLDSLLVQISTDYVFGGGAGRTVPYRESDLPSPEGVYSQSKLDGELAAATSPKHLIVRTCGLYSRPSHETGVNFVKTILRLARTKPVLRVVNDQHCTPSYVPHIARAIRFLTGVSEMQCDRLHPAPCGIYHVTNRGETTWYEFAREIVRRAGLDTPVEPITTEQYGFPTPRPAYSVLDNSTYERLGGPAMPDWKSALAEYFEELGGTAVV